MILSVLLTIVWLLLIPFGLGTWVTSLFSRKFITPGLILLNGYLSMTALFEVLFLPFLKLGWSFNALALVFAIISGVLALVSLIMGGTTFSSMEKPKFDFLFFVFLILTGFQIFMRVYQKVYDGDDAFFIATATTSLQSNTLFRINPYSGYEMGSLDVRHALASSPVYLAFLSKMTGLHPLIMAHIPYGIVLIVIYYCMIYSAGHTLFDDEKDSKYVSVFACMACVFTICGNISSSVPQTFMLMRTWQGKAVLANICIPAAFLYLIMAAKTVKEDKIPLGIYVMLGIAGLSATAMTTSGAVFIPALAVGGMLVISIVRKEYWVILKTFVSQIPAIAVGVVYLLLK